MLLAASLGAWVWRAQERRRRDVLPAEWQLAARPVFTADERRVHRSLREALPHHVLLSRLPLLRFCQPTDPGESRYWHELLGSSQVSFAICSANGRVLAAIDLDADREGSRRAAQVKQAALSACRVRYLRCAVDQLPSVAELQLLVPGAGADAHSPQPPAPLRATPPAPSTEADEALPSRRNARPVLWQDTTVFQDSFFPVDETLEDADRESFEPSSTRRAAAANRPTGGRLFSVGDSRRRGPQAVDFEPTRQQAFGADDEDDDDLGPGDRQDSRTPRVHPGSRS